ncbi:hypothetical protein GQR58_015016 [Nymphon striatum]|nr:hypothetical protein GQR58_015016 [Nymphon striatum]
MSDYENPGLSFRDQVDEVVRTAFLFQCVQCSFIAYSCIAILFLGLVAKLQQSTNNIVALGQVYTSKVEQNTKVIQNTIYSNDDRSFLSCYRRHVKYRISITLFDFDSPIASKNTGAVRKKLSSPTEKLRNIAGY